MKLAQSRRVEATEDVVCRVRPPTAREALRAIEAEVSRIRGQVRTPSELSEETEDALRRRGP